MTESRYSRQERLPDIGAEGQARLANAVVLVAGLGALGSVQAELLARAGVGRLRLADRDVPALSNLQRQFLYGEAEVASRQPKAEAAARRLREVNSEIIVEPWVGDITPATIRTLLEGVSLVLDGTDNAETRYLLNDACVQRGLPWIYGGVSGRRGQAMPILPGGPCLRCLFPDPPAPGTMPTCETTGVLNATTALVASLQVAAALRWLAQPAETRRPPPNASLTIADPWDQSFRTISVPRDPACPCCARRQFEFLEAQATSWASRLCGCDSVQISPAAPAHLDLAALEERLRKDHPTRRNGWLLEFSASDAEFTVFPDGRVIVAGTHDPARARTLVSQHLGM